MNGRSLLRAWQQWSEDTERKNAQCTPLMVYCPLHTKIKIICRLLSPVAFIGLINFFLGILPFAHSFYVQECNALGFEGVRERETAFHYSS